MLFDSLVYGVSDPLLCENGSNILSIVLETYVSAFKFSSSGKPRFWAAAKAFKVYDELLYRT